MSTSFPATAENIHRLLIFSFAVFPRFSFRTSEFSFRILPSVIYLFFVLMLFYTPWSQAHLTMPHVNPIAYVCMYVWQAQCRLDLRQNSHHGYDVSMRQHDTFRESGGTAAVRNQNNIFVGVDLDIWIRIAIVGCQTAVRAQP